jgi:hypothetical protein
LTTKIPHDPKSQAWRKVPRAEGLGVRNAAGTMVRFAKDGVYVAFTSRAKTSVEARKGETVHVGRKSSGAIRAMVRKLEFLAVSNRKLRLAVEALEHELLAVKVAQASSTFVVTEGDPVYDEDMSWAIERTKANASSMLLNQLSSDCRDAGGVDVRQRAERGERDRAEILAASLASLAKLASST